MFAIRIAPGALFTIVVTFATCIFYANTADFISCADALVILTVTMLLYLLCEIIRLYLTDSRRIFINPIFLCSSVTLGLYYGMNNMLHYMPQKMVDALEIKTVVTPSMVKLELLTIIAAGGMWIGYWSNMATNISNSNFLNTMRIKYFTIDAKLRIKVFITILVISVSSRMLQIYIGIYGYAAGYDAIMAAAAYSQYFNLLGSLGPLSVIVIAIEYYRDKNPPKLIKVLFYFTVFHEVYLGGFVTGFKSAVMMPFILVLLCQYARTGKANPIWIICIAVSISIAYPLVERFRSIRDAQGKAFPSTSIVQITRVMFSPTVEEINAASYVVEDGDGHTPTYLKIMARTSMLQIGSYGIDFYDQRNGNLPDSAPNVITDILLSPFYSWIPRFIWSGKTVQNIGIWYTQVVMKMAYSFSSTAMGTITYLYMGGTYWLTFCGFLFLGGLQRIFRDLFQPWLTCAGSLMSLATVGMISSIAEINLDAIIVLLVRVVPMLFLIQKLIYDHKVPTDKSL